MVLTKEDKYAELASSLGAEVVPAVIETFGALSDPLIGLFKDISKYALTKPYLVWSQHEIYQGLLLDTSLVLQKWNAKIILEGARSRCAHKSIPTFNSWDGRSDGRGRWPPLCVEP